MKKLYIVLSGVLWFRLSSPARFQQTMIIFTMGYKCSLGMLLFIMIELSNISGWNYYMVSTYFTTSQLNEFKNHFTFPLVLRIEICSLSHVIILYFPSKGLFYVLNIKWQGWFEDLDNDPLIYENVHWASSKYALVVPYTNYITSKFCGTAVTFWQLLLGFMESISKINPAIVLAWVKRDLRQKQK